MFKKLKEKITEEVKISPQRFVEFTQSVSDRLQSNSTSDDNFFSIGEDDANTSADTNNYGFSSVQLVSPSQETTRKNSTSSLASDVSFLPRYEPGSTYHLQSDLDISASELEDNASTTSSQLGHLSKDQIYSAFQKSQMRYHKYRGRYTDLTRHYKDLEREIQKMKSVLVETQDKAIRRVTELKEQCNLEQKAKAHLESALRDELDEKNYKIKTLKTQIGLLQNDNSSNHVINAQDNANNSSENLENLTKYLNESRKEIENLNVKIQELKANSIIFQSKEQEYKSKISKLEKEITQFSEREKENNLNLAQNKMELHNEILLKDAEISNLKRDNEIMKQKLELSEADGKSNGSQKMENLQGQNKKLIEKVETLTQKCNNMESDMIKMQTYKIEMDNFKQKNEELENQLNNLQKLNEELSNSNSQQADVLQREKENYEQYILQLREDTKKGLLSLEPKIRQKIELQFSEKEEGIRKEFATKLEELSSGSNTTKEIQLQLFEKEQLIKKLSEKLEETNSDLIKKHEAYSDLEKNHLELIEDSTKLRDNISNLEKDKLGQKEKVVGLEAYIRTLQAELKEFSSNKHETRIALVNFGKSLANTSHQLKVLEEQNIHLKSINDDFQLKLKALEEDKQRFEIDREIFTEVNKDLNEEIAKLKQNIVDENNKSVIISKERSNLEEQIKDLQEKIRLSELKGSAMNVDKNETELLELKFKKMEELLKMQVESVEKEHESIAKDLDHIKEELNLNEDEDSMSEFSRGGLELKLDILKDMCNKKAQSYNDLLLKQSNLQQEILSKNDQVEMLKSKINIVQGTNKDLEVNIQTLEDSILEEKENMATRISSSFQENLNKISELDKLLLEKQHKCSDLSEENSQLKNKLKEVTGAKQEFEASKHNLELTLERLEREYVQLQQKYDSEKSLFQEIVRINTGIIKGLEKDLFMAKQQYESEKINFELTSQKLQDLEGEFGRKADENNRVLQELTCTNEKLLIEKEEKQNNMSKLLSSISNLNNTIENQKGEINDLLTKTQQFDAVIENISLKNSCDAQREKDLRNEFDLKIEELNRELKKKSKEIVALNQNISQLENFNIEEKEKNEEKAAECTELESKLEKREIFLQLKYQEIADLTAERDILSTEVTSLKNNIDELTNKISQKGDDEKSLLHSENEKESLKLELAKIQEEISELNIRIQQLTLDNRNIMEENQSLSQEKEELKIALEILKQGLNNGPDVEKLKIDNVTLSNNIEDLKSKIIELQDDNLKLKNDKKSLTSNEIDIVKIQQDFYSIKEKCDDLFIENKNLKLEYSVLEDRCNSFGKVKAKLETQINDLESQYNDLVKEKQLLEDEVQELKIAPVNYHNDSSRLDNLETLKKEQSFLKDSEQQSYIRELESLRDKLTKYKSLDITNKSSIEFYENELQKVKNQNDKLNRRLDETIVTLNHCTELSSSTEVEYLKNVLYNYMLGKESLVLARVIAAVCKFDPQQTELILQKEQQKQTLLGQLGLI